MPIEAPIKLSLVYWMIKNENIKWKTKYMIENSNNILCSFFIIYILNTIEYNCRNNAEISNIINPYEIKLHWDLSKWVYINNNFIKYSSIKKK